MKVGVIIYSDDPETAWNALRVANFALAMGDQVTAFIIGRGVTVESVGTAKFDVDAQLHTFLHTGGKLLACGTCLEIHGIKPSDIYQVSTLKDAYELIQGSDRVLTF